MRTQTVGKAEGAKRDAIVQQAYEVFYKRGFHATPVDGVLADTGISKRTVYKYFESKEALIAATVAHYQEVTFARIEREIGRRATSPTEKILALFDLKREALEEGDFSGCFAINAKLEYEGKETLIEEACGQFFKALENFIAALCAEAGCRRPDDAAKRISILLDGAIVYGLSTRDPEIVRIARAMAEALLQGDAEA